MSQAQPTDEALLDSGILIRYLRGWQKAATFISTLRLNQTLYVSAATVAEILVGCRSDAELKATAQVLAEFETLAIDYEVARLAALLIRKHPGIFGRQVTRGFADALIFASAWRYAVTLYTLNVRHFARLTIPEVRVHLVEQDAPEWV